jgi:FlaA1/EpsC-like NDP-sugar epimerase
VKLDADYRYLIFGGTGSLGKTLVRRIQVLNPRNRIFVFSRDEAKQYRMKEDFPDVSYVIGDIRDYDAVLTACKKINPHVVINCAAMKQVPACEDYPYEAVLTNVVGTRNVVRATKEVACCYSVLSVSTDKACKPVNSYGMTKALQERIHLNAGSGFVCVRYGNVLESTGSVIPIFKRLLNEDKSLKITDPKMTRFLLSLDEAVDLIFKALEIGSGGETFIPKPKSANIIHVAQVLSSALGKGNVSEVDFVGVRPGEKVAEITISEEELLRTEDRGDVFVVHDIRSNKTFKDVQKEYSSGNIENMMNVKELQEFLKKHKVI